MNKKTTRRVLAGMGIAAMVGAGAISQQSAEASTTADLSVTASVAANCAIEAPTALAFGPYDPADANAAANAHLDQDTDIRVRCTRGAVARVDLDLGEHSALGERRMVGTDEGEFLVYELYSDSSHSTVWGSGAGNGVAYTPSNNGWFDLTVYGRVPGGQDVIVDSYADSVTATVNF